MVAAASKGGVESDALYAQVRRRLLDNGEWDHIQHVMASKLDESGWVDDLRHRGKEKAINMSPLSFRALLDELSQYAQTSVPLAVKKEITALIQHYLEQQIES